MTAYAVSCAGATLSIVAADMPGDPRPATAMEAARLFAGGGTRSNLQRTAAADAHRAGREAPTLAASHAATATGDAAAAAYLHPLARSSQVRHILGAAAHAARAAELARGDDPVVAEYMLHGAARRMTPTVREVLERYPRAPAGRTRVAVLMQRVDSLVRDPAREPEPAQDAGPFFHGTKADLRPGDLLTPGWGTNYGSGKTSRHIYLTASQHGAPLAAALALGDGAPRVYRVEPLGPIYDDPNVTDKEFPGDPTRSYRTRDPLRVVAEVTEFAIPDPALVERIRTNAAELKELGIEAMHD